jgi:hypothetical protein
MVNFSGKGGRLHSLAALLLSAVLSACSGGGKGPILGGLSVSTAPVAPTVIAVSPLPNASAVAINTKVLTARFSLAMDPATLLATSFAVACPSGTVVTGSVSYVAATKTASLTLPTTPNLPANTTCVATVTTAAIGSNGLALAAA